MIRETVIRETLIRETLIRETVMRETVMRETLIRETLIHETVMRETLIRETWIVYDESDYTRMSAQTTSDFVGILKNNKSYYCYLDTMNSGIVHLASNRSYSYKL